MASDDALLAVLRESRDLGFLGPGPVEAHIAHARAYLSLLPDRPATAMDLGTGGGIPGLALALWRPDLHWVLVDAMAKRVAFVQRSVAALGLAVEVLETRLEVLALDGRRRDAADVVVARSLAAPGVAAEYAAPLLKVGGRALIAEPPGGNLDRWSTAGLARLGMRRGDTVPFEENATLQILEQVDECPAQFPRRVGVAAKRPLF